MSTQTATTTASDYRKVFAFARAAAARVAEATSPPEAMPETARYFLTTDGASGFGIDADGTLIGLFSTVKGRGDALVKAAVENGATRLDCFDGYLPALYARHGFRETHREANWTPGEPDVVFMVRD